MLLHPQLLVIMYLLWVYDKKIVIIAYMRLLIVRSSISSVISIAIGTTSDGFGQLGQLSVSYHRLSTTSRL